MIGETAYETKAGGRCLGTIVGQRTVQDAERRPVEQWEIRSGRGIKFFMDKAGVRVGAPPPGGPTPGERPLGEPPLGAPPPGGPPPGEPPLGGPPIAPRAEPEGAGEPEAPPVVPVVEAVTKLEVKSAIGDDLRRRRSPVPTVVTFIGVALCIVCGLLFGLGLQRRVGEVAGVPMAFAPGLLGLLVILVGTNLIGEQARRLQKRRIELLQQARARASAEAQARTSGEMPESESEETQ